MNPIIETLANEFSELIAEALCCEQTEAQVAALVRLTGQVRAARNEVALATRNEMALRRAFVEHHADCIVITSRREQFQAEVMDYGIERGWLTGSWVDSDEQSAAYVCRLTPEGRKHFGLAVEVTKS